MASRIHNIPIVEQPEADDISEALFNRKPTERQVPFVVKYGKRGKFLILCTVTSVEYKGAAGSIRHDWHISGIACIPDGNEVPQGWRGKTLPYTAYCFLDKPKGLFHVSLDM